MVDTPLLPYSWDPIWDENQSIIFDELNQIIHVTEEPYQPPNNTFQNTSQIVNYTIGGGDQAIRGPAKDNAGRTIHWD